MTLTPRKSNDIAHHLQLPVILNRGDGCMLPAEWATQNKHTLVAIRSRVVEKEQSRQGYGQQTSVNLRDRSPFLSAAARLDHLADDCLLTSAVDPAQRHQQRRPHHDHHHRRTDHYCLPHSGLPQRPVPRTTAPRMVASGGSAPRSAPLFQNQSSSVSPARVGRLTPMSFLFAGSFARSCKTLARGRR
jgi:hypothetical protein